MTEVLAVEAEAGRGLLGAVGELREGDFSATEVIFILV